MSTTTVNLGYVPKNRGEYSSTASYYKDNIVQYNGSSYICNPPNYDPDTAPTASITGVAPYASDPAVPNTGWAVFCNDSSGVGEGVYDVSVDHTTDSQPKKYADLSAALQDVPQAKQKGGMTIRFIQSSDNKYVQYRLMSDSFNTTVANWQGVDGEPTAGSDNLVKSGGVSKKQAEVINSIYNQQISGTNIAIQYTESDVSDTSLWQNGYMNSYGILVGSGTTYYTGKLKLRKGSYLLRGIYGYILMGLNGVRAIDYTANINYADTLINVTQDGQILYFWFNNSNLHHVLDIAVIVQKANLESDDSVSATLDIAGLKEYYFIAKEELLTPEILNNFDSTFEHNVAIRKTGTTYAASNYHVSPYLEISACKYRLVTSLKLAYAAIYDENKAFLASFSKDYADLYDSNTTVDNAESYIIDNRFIGGKYIRFSVAPQANQDITENLKKSLSLVPLSGVVNKKVFDKDHLVIDDFSNLPDFVTEDSTSIKLSRAVEKKLSFTLDFSVNERVNINKNIGEVDIFSTTLTSGAVIKCRAVTAEPILLPATTLVSDPTKTCQMPVLRSGSFIYVGSIKQSTVLSNNYAYNDFFKLHKSFQIKWKDTNAIGVTCSYDGTTFSIDNGATNLYSFVCTNKKVYDLWKDLKDNMSSYLDIEINTIVDYDCSDLCTFSNVPLVTYYDNEDNSNFYTDSAWFNICLGDDLCKHYIEMYINKDDGKWIMSYDGMGFDWSQSAHYSNLSKYFLLEIYKTEQIKCDYAEWWVNDNGDIEESFDYVEGAAGRVRTISSRNPLLIAFEGHNILNCPDMTPIDTPINTISDYGTIDSTPFSDLTNSTDRLKYLFALMDSRKYTPVSMDQIYNYLTRGDKLPKRCYIVMFDDYRVINYWDLRLRNAFKEYNVKPMLAIVTKSIRQLTWIDSSGNNHVVEAKQVIQSIMNNGWDCILHTYNHSQLGKVRPSEIEDVLYDSVMKSDEYGMRTDILVYPFGSHNALVRQALSYVGIGVAFTSQGQYAINRNMGTVNVSRVNITNNQSFSDLVNRIIV